MGLGLLIDNLKVFGCKEFTDAFLINMKKELKVAVEMANKPFDWECIDHSATYLIRLHKRRKRNTAVVDDWKKDPGEKSNKIWCWWKAKKLIGENKITNFLVAITLVVLTQLSSCGVERVFSRLK